jgi:D-alanyl-D-alanine-carboxypeptidase/D-alanyl-D-alanine-endopeptidase
MTHRFTLPLTLFALTSLVYAATSEELRGFLVNRVDEGKRAVGIIVAGINEAGQEVIPYGKVSKDRPGEINADTIFEIGSTTKVFTSLLLADMVERGEVQLDTPVADLLPAGVKVPEWEGKKITLLDLSMQISGLPRMPTNMHPKDLGNVYADYTPANLYAFLSGYTLPRAIGAQYEYSNLGAGLLGHALSRKAGMSYEQLLRKRIFEPLGMHDTGITLTPEQMKRMATSYDPALGPVKYWSFDALAGCGAIRSSANDMLKFLAANMELTDTPLKPAMRRMRSVHQATGVADLDIMMAWHDYKKFGTEIVWHSGSTAGAWSFFGFDPARKVGVVILTNTYLDIDDVGLHAIEKEFPVKTFETRKEHKEIKVDSRILSEYVGEYRFTPTIGLKIVLENGHLYGQPPTQPRFELFAEQEGLFYVKVLDAGILFERDKKGKMAALWLYENGKTSRAEKLR